CEPRQPQADHKAAEDGFVEGAGWDADVGEIEPEVGEVSIVGAKAGEADDGDGREDENDPEELAVGQLAVGILEDGEGLGDHFWNSAGGGAVGCGRTGGNPRACGISTVPMNNSSSDGRSCWIRRIISPPRRSESRISWMCDGSVVLMERMGLRRVILWPPGSVPTRSIEACGL